MKKYKIQDSKNITTILNYVHDRFFDIDKIIFDREKRYLKIPISVIDDKCYVSGRFLVFKKLTHNVLASELIIYNVEDYKLIDQAHTGQGDINTMTMEGDNLIIKCGLPVTIKVKTSELYIELSLTDNIVGQKSYISWRWTTTAT